MNDLPRGRLDGNINPFTGDPIPTVDSSGWATASVSDLYKQLAVLERRLWAAHSMGKGDIVRQIQPAIDAIRQAIAVAQDIASKQPIKRRANGSTPETASPTFD